MSVINNGNDTTNKCNNNTNEPRHENGNGIKNTSFTSPVQVPNKSKFVEYRDDNNNIVEDIAEKLNNSSKRQ